jgi:hypothetical protein
VVKLNPNNPAVAEQRVAIVNHEVGGVTLGWDQRPVKAVLVFIVPVQPNERPDLVFIRLGKRIGGEG